MAAVVVTTDFFCNHLMSAIGETLLLEPPTAREKVIEIPAYGMCELVMGGCKPDQTRNVHHPVLGAEARQLNEVGNRHPAASTAR
jgi:hypothetical protein